MSLSECRLQPEVLPRLQWRLAAILKIAGMTVAGLDNRVPFLHKASRSIEKLPNPAVPKAEGLPGAARYAKGWGADEVRSMQ